MKTPEEKRWERIRDFLLAESRGDAPVRVSSQRTLFGIKSHVEQVIDSVAAEDRAKCEKNLHRQDNSETSYDDPTEDGEQVEQQENGSEDSTCNT